MYYKDDPYNKTHKPKKHHTFISKLRDIVGVLVGVIGWIYGLYVGIWVMFIQPIIYACQCFDAGTLTAAIIGITVLKCLFASTVGLFIIILFTFIAQIIITGRANISIK